MPASIHGTTTGETPMCQCVSHLTLARVQPAAAWLPLPGVRGEAKMRARFVVILLFRPMGLLGHK